MPDRHLLQAGLLAAVLAALVATVPLVAWDLGPPTPFQFSRFDAGFYPGDGQVYFLGGRFGTATDGSIWWFDPDAATYGDTGVDLAVPISNYTMNLVRDANGWGFYVFCGRDAAGTTVRTVQVYYPGTNTAVALPAADDFPNPVGCMGGLNVVWRDKVYVAGGFYSLGPTFNHGETWVFDPLAPSGSRWTQLPSANLAMPRSYIMGVLYDDRIYAIGGSWYDGASLVSMATVEVLDPKAATPTWDDASVADLPEGCSEGRAWAVDSFGGYLIPERDSAGGNILTTCGGWPTENEHAYIYKAARDTWQLVEPNLSSPRRDQAGELLFPSSGAPGLWMWGGRSLDDTTPVTTVEYLPLLPSACRLVLVDDDWDFSGSSGGGRLYYASALDTLGYAFEDWSTVAQGPPQTSDLASHTAAVWFTGYDWQLAVDATEEAALIGYLDDGGSLLLSATDQIYANGLTPLLQTYMGVGSAVEDVTLRLFQGNPADPAFAGYGPYLLARPDDWEAYWPTDTNEGPYTDEIHAGGATGVTEAMLWTPENTPNTVRRATTVYRTMFMAWPFEWIDTVSERGEVMGRALHWMCPVLEDGFESGDTGLWTVVVP